jgi:hypothetical protein
MAGRKIVLIIPLCVMAGGQYLLARSARPGPLCESQRGQTSRNEPHSGPSTATDVESRHVTVRVYDAAGLDANVTSAAFAAASHAFEAASIELSWTMCPRAGAMPPCDRPPTGELVVRIVLAVAEHQKSTVALGDALVDGSAHTATLATIYANNVTRMADAAEVPYGRVIGYAIAHELGHLLLASSSHSERGLMRALWHYEDLRSGPDENWTFSAADAAALRARVLGNAANIVWGTR